MTLSPLHQSELTQIFGSNHILLDPSAVAPYSKDWTSYFDTHASCVVFPMTTEQVSQLVLWARKHKFALVPSGGRTGLSGAACALHGEVIVSFERMNQILGFNKIDRLVHIQAGVVTEEVQSFAREQALHYPVDFAARGSSQMGGNIATNAGGIKVIRYGMTREWIRGLTVVTGRGDVLNLNQGLIKNASGYDLRHLIIGSEGTLGFVTEALVQLTPAPKKTQTVLLAVSSMEMVLKVFQLFSENLQLEAFEMFSDLALKKVMASSGLPHPLATQAPFWIVLETDISFGQQQEENVLSTLEAAIEQNLVLDGAIAQTTQQAKTFWRYREDISESLSRYSPYKNDVSVRISNVWAFMQDLERVLRSYEPSWEIVWFGHIGDGNLHINILRPPDLTKEEFVKKCQKVDQEIFSSIKKFSGSISAEHGVGLTKKPFLGFCRSPAEVEIFKSIKLAFDPDQILNPGKIF